MRDFALAPEVEELRAAAERLARSELAPNVREHEAAGRWPDAVQAVLDGFPLGDLDLPEHLGGAGAGCVAKTVILETLAKGDAAGLAAADRPGPCAGAVVACPDAALVAEVLASLRDGHAHCAFTVVDPEVGSNGVDWAPARRSVDMPPGRRSVDMPPGRRSVDMPPGRRSVDMPPGQPALRWVWASEGALLRLHEVTGTPTPVQAVAFQASGGVTVPFEATTVRGAWELTPHQRLAMLGRARLWGAAIAVGIAQAALDETIGYTMDRVVFGKPVAHHQGNAFDIAVAAAGVHGARLVVRDAAAAYDRDEPDAGFWATQAWLETMDAAFVATNTGIQLLGGHGFIVDHLAEKRFREARHLALSAGGRDAAEFDVAGAVLDVPDPLLATLER